MSTISICLAVPDEFLGPAAYTFETLALRWGIPVTFTTRPEGAMIVYGARTTDVGSQAMHIPCDPRLYLPDTERSHGRPFGFQVWGKANSVSELAGDLVAGAYRLLTYLDESRVAESARDRCGTFPTAALSGSRRAIAGEPIVEQHAALLLHQMLLKHPGLDRAILPRWPNGKRWALAVTHDADHVHIGSCEEIVSSLLGSIRRLDGTKWKLFRLGFRYRNLPCRNPYFMFPRWHKWEGQRRITSAFYLYVRPNGVRRDADDCKSTVADPRMDWIRLKEMAASGWEFGLHPSIHAKESPESLLTAKAYLEKSLGTTVDGLRHHRLALDWRRPYATHSAHARCGFRYDSSVAWRDEPGFRAATCLPYRPFDPDEKKTVPIHVIPCSLKDRHVMRWSSAVQDDQYQAAVEAGQSIINRVRSAGGVAVLDWHQESAFNELEHVRHLDVLRDLLKPILKDSSVWIATPGEICRHWEELTDRIAPAQHLEVGSRVG